MDTVFFITIFQGSFDDVTCLAWSPCSRIVAVGSKDSAVRLFALKEFENFRSYALGGHNEAVRAVFFAGQTFLKLFSYMGKCVRCPLFNSQQARVP